MLDPFTRLCTAIGNGNLPIVKKIVSRFPELLGTFGPGNGWSALHHAAHHGNYLICHYLVTAMFLQGLLTENPRPEDETREILLDFTGNTPLHLSISEHQQNSQTVHFLLQRFPELLDLRNHGGLTATHLAASHGRVDVLSLLLDFQANLRCVDERGDTPLHLCCMNGHLGCIEQILTRTPAPGQTYIDLTDVRNFKGWVPKDVCYDYDVERYYISLHVRYSLVRETPSLLPVPLSTQLHSSSRGAPLPVITLARERRASDKRETPSARISPKSVASKEKDDVGGNLSTPDPYTPRSMSPQPSDCSIESHLVYQQPRSSNASKSSLDLGESPLRSLRVVRESLASFSPVPVLKSLRLRKAEGDSMSTRTFRSHSDSARRPAPTMLELTPRVRAPSLTERRYPPEDSAWTPPAFVVRRVPSELVLSRLPSETVLNHASSELATLPPTVVGGKLCPELTGKMPPKGGGRATSTTPLRRPPLESPSRAPLSGVTALSSLSDVPSRKALANDLSRKVTLEDPLPRPVLELLCDRGSPPTGASPHQRHLENTPTTPIETTSLAATLLFPSFTPLKSATSNSSGALVASPITLRKQPSLKDLRMPLTNHLKMFHNRLAGSTERLDSALPLDAPERLSVEATRTSLDGRTVVEAPRVLDISIGKSRR